MPSAPTDTRISWRLVDSRVMVRKRLLCGNGTEDGDSDCPATRVLKGCCAIAATARHLLTVVWSVLTNHEPYRHFSPERMAYLYPAGA
jgi:hypothetical protein